MWMDAAQRCDDDDDDGYYSALWNVVDASGRC